MVESVLTRLALKERQAAVNSPANRAGVFNGKGTSRGQGC
jgi:hypothetical protein